MKWKFIIYYFCTLLSFCCTTNKEEEDLHNTSFGEKEIKQHSKNKKNKNVGSLCLTNRTGSVNLKKEFSNLIIFIKNKYLENIENINTQLSKQSINKKLAQLLYLNQYKFGLIDWGEDKYESFGKVNRIPDNIKQRQFKKIKKKLDTSNTSSLLPVELQNIIYSYFADNILDNLDQNNRYQKILYKKLQILGFEHSKKYVKNKIKKIFKVNNPQHFIINVAKEQDLNFLWLILTDLNFKSLFKNYNDSNAFTLSLKLIEKYSSNLVKPGLNLLCICENPECSIQYFHSSFGYKGRIGNEDSIPFNIGKLLGMGKVLCPKCGTFKTEVIRILLYKCKFELLKISKNAEQLKLQGTTFCVYPVDVDDNDYHAEVKTEKL